MKRFKKKSIVNKCVFFFLTILLFLGVGCLTPQTNISRPVRLPNFSAKIKPKFYISKVEIKTISHSWFDFGTETFIPTIVNTTKLMQTARSDYPQLFDASESAIPLIIKLKWTTDKSENIINFNMTSEIDGVKFIDQSEFISIKDPYSRRYHRYLSNDNFYCRVILWSIVQGIYKSDKEMITSVYRIRSDKELRRQAELRAKIAFLTGEKKVNSNFVISDNFVENNADKVNLKDNASPRRYYAFVLGVGKYQSDKLPTLPYADDDAVDFVSELKRGNWRESSIKTLVNEEATRSNIQAALEGWLTKADKNDLILLYWSGHGFSDPADPEKVYLACYDSDPRRPWTGYRMDKVINSLKEKGVRNVIVIADTCHAGKLITRGERGLSVTPYIYKIRNNQQIPKGWIYMVSADTDRKAVEDSRWRNGAFTYCLLRGMRGEADGFEGIGKKDNVVTLRELRAYLHSKMPEETQRILGVAKHPLITTNSSDPQIWQLSIARKKE